MEEIGAGALFSEVALQVSKREVLMGEVLNPAQRQRLKGGRKEGRGERGEGREGGRGMDGWMMMLQV